MPDSAEIKLGTGDDLQIFHDGTNTHISNSTGGLFINQYLDDGDIALRTDDGSGGFSTYVLCDGSTGNVRLYYYGTEKFKTTSNGVKITGGLQDKDGQLGSSGQVLSSTGTQLNWVDADTGPQGVQGVAGSDGTIGVDGAQGLAGIQGAIGPDGGNAGTLDNLDSSQFLRSDANDTFTETITGDTLHLGDSQISSSAAKLQVNGFMRTGSVYIHQGGGSPNTNSKELSNVSGELFWENQEVWNAGNDGSGSGLDADKVDGLQASSFIRSDADDTSTGRLTLQRGFTSDTDYHLYINQTTNGEGATIRFTDQSSGSQFGLFTYKHTDGHSNSAENSFHFDSSESSTAVIIDQTAGNSGFYVGTNEVWHAGNDGSGSGLDADTVDGVQASNIHRTVATASATVGPGWITVATNTSGRKHGEIIVSDSESGDHGFIRIDWMRSFADSNFTVLNCGGHSNRITGARVLYQNSDNTYGEKILQVYVTVSSNYRVQINQVQNQDGWAAHTVHTPVVESPSGYSVHGNTLSSLQTYGLAHEEGIQAGGSILAGGDITSSSDISLKENVVTYENALDKVLAMRGVEYDRKDQNGKHEVGLIAQEVENIIPEVVAQNNGIKSIAYGKLTAVLIEAIKEQQEQIKHLQQQLNIGK